MKLQAEYIDLTRAAPILLGPLEIRPATREVVAADAREMLEPRVMQVLVALAREPGEVVSRDELITMCWAGRVVGDDAINRCIGRIRGLSEAYGGFELETLPRIGYRLTATSTPVEPAQSQTVSPPDEPVRSRNRWRGPVLIAVAVLVLAAAGLVWRNHGEKLITVEAPPRHMIAVLPFSQLSSDAGFKSFGDVVAAAVADTLGKVGEPVVSPAESFQFRGAAKAGAARTLRAMYIVDGDVLKDGNVVRVTVRLDDAVRGETIFARSFEEKAERASVLPDRVAAYIAAISWGFDVTHWNLKLAPETLRAFEQQERGDLFAAYETAKRLATATPDDGDIQRVYASNAINLIYTSRAKRKLWLINDARQAAERSLARMPDEGEAFGVLASATPHFLWAEREKYLRQGLAVTPDSIGLAEYLTWILNDTGRFRDAEPWARSAYERFPYHVEAFQRRAEQLLGSGDAAAAAPVLAQALRLWPENQTLRTLAFEAAAFEWAPERAERLLRDSEMIEHERPATLKLWQDVTRALRSRKAADADAVARDCAAPGDNGLVCLAALSVLGRPDAAFAIADRLYIDQRATSRDGLMTVWLANPETPSTRVLFIPATVSMRADPRFRDLVERIGVLQAWTGTGHRPDFCAAEPAPVCRLLQEKSAGGPRPPAR